MDLIRMFRNVAIGVIALVGFAAVPGLRAEADNAQSVTPFTQISDCKTGTCGGVSYDDCCYNGQDVSVTCVGTTAKAKCSPPAPPSG